MLKWKKYAIAVIVIIALVAFSVWVAWGNTYLTVSEFEIKNGKIPQSFHGFRIAQISDLHNAEFGEKNVELLDKLEEIHPNIIVITGDLIDSYRPDLDVCIDFAKKAMNIAPTYYVSGNHEHRIDNYEALKQGVADCGVIVLENEKTEICVGGEKITIIGIRGDNPDIDTTLSKLVESNDGYTIVLSHYPELFDAYVKNSIELIFSGHAHGGQFRIPFIGGLIAPGQGLFPQYDSGLYTKDNTSMIVSRGIGNSLFPFRINNYPEIVVAELRCD